MLHLKNEYSRVFYRLCDAPPGWLNNIFSIVACGFDHGKDPTHQDLPGLKSMDINAFRSVAHIRFTMSMEMSTEESTEMLTKLSEALKVYEYSVYHFELDILAYIVNVINSVGSMARALDTLTGDELQMLRNHIENIKPPEVVVVIPHWVGPQLGNFAPPSVYSQQFKNP